MFWPPRWRFTASTGCGRTVTGSALRDPDLPGVTLTADGFGIIAGRPDAPAQIEVYTEPQCTHCAHLQDTDGPEMKSLIARPADRHLPPGDIPGHRVRLFGQGRQRDVPGRRTRHVGARPAGVRRDAVGPPESGRVGTVDGQLAGWAADAGVSAEAVATIQFGEHAVDTDEMTMTNETRLQEIRDGDAGTPTVYDLTGNTVVDIQETGVAGEADGGAADLTQPALHESDDAEQHTGDQPADDGDRAGRDDVEL